MNKGIIYCTKIREEYEGAHMEHMIAEKLLEIALKKEYGINLYNEPRAEGEHGKPFLSYRPSLHYNISHSGKYVVCILADQEVGIDVQIHCRANYERIWSKAKIHTVIQFSRCQKFHLPFLHNPQIQPLPELKPPACFQDTGKDFFPPCTGKKVIVQKA